jgi:hypothetical protein
VLVEGGVAGAGGRWVATVPGAGGEAPAGGVSPVL